MMPNLLSPRVQAETILRSLDSAAHEFCAAKGFPRWGGLEIHARFPVRIKNEFLEFAEALARAFGHEIDEAWLVTIRSTILAPLPPAHPPLIQRLLTQGFPMSEEKR